MATLLLPTKVKGIRYRELGITPARSDMIKNGKRRVSGGVLERLLDRLTARDQLELAGRPYDPPELKNPRWYKQ